MDIKGALEANGIIIPTNCQCGKPGRWREVRKKAAFFNENNRQWSHTGFIGVMCDECAERFIHSGYTTPGLKTRPW